MKINEIYQFRYAIIEILKQAIFLPYNQSSVIFILTLLRPFLFLLIFLMLKRNLSGLISEDIPYPLYLYLGLVIWWFISDSIKQSTSSFKYYRKILLKIYLPRFLIPIIPVIARLFDFLIHLFGFFVFVFFLNEKLNFNFIVFFLSIINLICVCISIGCFLSFLTFKFKVVDPFVDYLIFIGFFLSPVIYTIDKIPMDYLNIYKFLNPFLSPLLNIRASFISNLNVDYSLLYFSTIFYFLLLLIILFLFNNFINESIEKL